MFYLLWGNPPGQTTGCPPLSTAGQGARSRRRKRTKVQFCLDYAKEVFNRVAPMRQRTPVGMCIMQAQVTNSAEYCSPASAHVMARTEHELVDMDGWAP